MRVLSRRAAFLLVVMSVSALVLVYPPLRLTTLLWPQWSIPLWLPPVLIAVPLVLRFLHEQMHHSWSRLVSAWVMTWLGICFVLLCLVFGAEFVVLLTPINEVDIGIGVSALLILICLYGIFNAHRLSVHTVDLPAQKGLQGTTLVQLSDVHIGSRQPGFLRGIVTKVNALQADYVVITGDLIDMHGIDEMDLGPLAEIESPTLFCIGNHERYVDLEAICQRLSNLGIEVLRNRSVTKNDIVFIGIDDAEHKTQVSTELNKMPKNEAAFNVLLYHRPDDAEAAAGWGVDLMLTGHTHRGQIFPFNFLVKRIFPRLYRDYDIQDMTLYVSPGTGTWGPVMRLGSKCEITLFRL